MHAVGDADIFTINARNGENHNIKLGLPVMLLIYYVIRSHVGIIREDIARIIINFSYHIYIGDNRGGKK
jgi:hypothetical protein